MIEICTFFPNWFQIPEVVIRAQRNGWSRKDVAKAQLYPLGLLNKANMKSAEDRIQKQFGDGGRLVVGLPAGQAWSADYATNMGPHDDLTATKWQFRSEYPNVDANEKWQHMKLADIGQQVPNRARWPRNDPATVSNRLLLTQCIEFACLHPYLNLDTSHIQWLIDMKPFTLPQGVNLNASHDRDALQDLDIKVADPTT